MSLIAVMGKTLQTRFKGSNITSADVKPLVQQHIKKAVDIDYRESQSGAMNRDTLLTWLEFLTQLPAWIKQTELASTLLEWANDNEQIWQLKGEADDWSTKTAKKIRAMRGDVCRCINRPQRPRWFLKELERLGIDINGIDNGDHQADEIENVDAANAESQPQETEKASCTAQSVTAGEDEPVLSQTRARAETTAPSDCGGKFIYKIDEDCQAHSYG